MPESIDSNDLTEVASEVLEELGASMPSLGAPVVTEGERLSSYVQILGPASGPGLAIEADRAVAADFASRLLDLQPADVTEVDLNDAVNELTNLLAGSIKLLIEEETKLDVPEPIPADIAVIAVADVHHDYGLIRIALLKQAAAAAA